MGLSLILVLLAIDGLLIYILIQGPITLLSFVWGILLALSLPLLILLGYRVYGFFNMEYRLDRDALTIVWAGVQQVIPISDITQVLGGEEGAGTRVKGPRWPGYRVGRGRIKGMEPALFYATRPPAEQLWVLTPTMVYAISPENPLGFLEALELRQRLGPLHELSQGVRPARLVALAIWGDGLAHILLALGLTANAALFAYVCWRYPALPQFLPLHFDALGQADRIGVRAEVFRLPGMGGLVLAINAALGFAVHQREKVGAYLLWGGAFVVQVIFWLAALSIIG